MRWSVFSPMIAEPNGRWTRWTSPLSVDLDTPDTTIGIGSIKVEFGGPVRYHLRIEYEDGRPAVDHLVCFEYRGARTSGMD